MLQTVQDFGGDQMQITYTSTDEVNPYLITNSRLTQEAWYHVVGVIDTVNGVISIYLNGNLDTSESIPHTALKMNTDWPITIGKRQTGYGIFNGEIDEVSVWDRALSSVEVKVLYNSGAGRKGDTTQPPWNDGLVAGWHFDEGTGTAAADFSGNSNNATLVDGPTWEGGIIPSGEGTGSWDYIVSWGDNIATTQYTDTAGLIPSTSYRYRVRAYNGDQVLTYPGSAIYTKTLATMSSYYMTKVGSNEEWSWKNSNPGDKVPSGTIDDWFWRTWNSGSGRKVPSGEAHDWKWGEE
jgi:hypothetical protein